MSKQKHPELHQEQYSSIRGQMQTGDIIAFSGNARISRLVKLATFSNISHIGIVTHATVSHLGTLTVEIMESVKEAEHPETGQIITGVTRNRLSTKIRNYNGSVYWLPLSQDTRKKLDTAAAIKFLMSVLGRPYDMPQALLAAIDLLDFTEKVTYACEDYSSVFCSELAAAALKAGRVLPDINPSEMTPIDLLRLPIYFKHYYQLKGVNHQPITF